MNGWTTDTIRVLHVDDESDFADLAGTSLERVNSQIAVETETNASEGLNRLSDTEFDCIVSEYEMSGQNGIEFLDTVREDYPNLPFILYTGNGSEEVASEAIATGVTDYLRKQAGTEQYELLANRIQNAVEQYRTNKYADYLERIHNLVADINQAIVRSTSRPEIKSRVCEIIANSEFYHFAWIGEQNPDAQTVEARASAGIERGFLDDIVVTTDGSTTSQGPAGRAIRTREMVVVQNISEDSRFSPWREAALERGYRSCSALPLVSGKTMHGILVVYSGRVEAFDQRVRDLLSELADDIAQALHHEDVQRNLRRERDRLDLVKEIEQYAIFMMDQGGRISTWNRGAEQIKGYTRDEILGSHYRAFFPEEAIEQETPKQLLARAEVDGSVKGRGWRIRKDGSRLWADFTLTALYDDSDNLRGFAKVTQDMTDWWEHDQQLKRQNERLEEFTSTVSHDLRNPLHVAAGRLHLLREECDSDHLDDAVHAIDRSLELVDDLLSLARDGKQASAVEEMNLAETAKWCWRSIETANATLIVETNQTISAVPIRLKQLLDNLFANAIDHGGDGVTVTVGKLENGFYVSDNGSGIPKIEREHVFENGYSTGDGTGLGLVLVRESVDAHDWDIAITDSRAGGARFEISGVKFPEN